MVPMSGAAPGAGQTFTYTLYKNGSPTTITATTSDSATISSDLTHEITGTSGDQIYIKVVASGSAAVTAHTATFEFMDLMAP
jgi:hypothetical protein